MIDGVNLITTETICISGGFLSNLIPAIIAAIGCIVAIVVSISWVKEEKAWVAFFFCLSMGLCLGCLGIVSFMCFNDAFNPRYEERYLVQLDDKISSEFIDKYDIVERKDNNVYIIKERNTND